MLAKQNVNSYMEIAIIIALILLNGVFAMSEIALISARKSSLSNDIRHGSSTARIALKLANDPDKFLSTIQIGITLIGILTGIYSGDVLATDFGNITAVMRLTAMHEFQASLRSVSLHQVRVQLILLLLLLPLMRILYLSCA